MLAFTYYLPIYLPMETKASKWRKGACLYSTGRHELAIPGMFLEHLNLQHKTSRKILESIGT